MAFFHRSGGEGDAEPIAEINMIPLIDVMLVLLVIFMVTAPLSVSGIKIKLPEVTAKGKEFSASRLVLTVDVKGDFYIDKVQIAADALVEKLESLAALRSDKQLYIRADRGVVYAKVVDAMSAAKLAGIDKLSMLTTPRTTIAAKK